MTITKYYWNTQFGHVHTLSWIIISQLGSWEYVVIASMQVRNKAIAILIKDLSFLTVTADWVKLGSNWHLVKHQIHFRSHRCWDSLSVISIAPCSHIELSSLTCFNKATPDIWALSAWISSYHTSSGKVLKYTVGTLENFHKYHFTTKLLSSHSVLHCLCSFWVARPVSGWFCLIIWTHSPT
jgi:hypothetical protein